MCRPTLPGLVLLAAAVLLVAAARPGAMPEAGAAPAPVFRPPTKRILNSLGMKLVYLRPGTFLMGSPKDEIGRAAHEGPVRQVELTRGFYLGVFEVTQAEFETVTGTNPSSFAATGSRKDEVKGLDTARFPVENVSHAEAVAFCEKLSALPAEAKQGRVYRLPTEAEWEFACRAGSPAPFAFGSSLSSTQGNFDGRATYGSGREAANLARTCTVGRYPPNSFGLYDMHGNVSEWCADWYAEDYFKHGPRVDPTGPASGGEKVHRGGDHWSGAAACRSAAREADHPGRASYRVGFRVALSSPRE